MAPVAPIARSRIRHAGRWKSSSMVNRYGERLLGVRTESGSRGLQATEIKPI